MNDFDHIEYLDDLAESFEASGGNDGFLDSLKIRACAHEIEQLRSRLSSANADWGLLWPKVEAVALTQRVKRSPDRSELNDLTDAVQEIAVRRSLVCKLSVEPPDGTDVEG